MKEASANILLMAVDDDAEELEILQSILDEHSVLNYQLHTSVQDFFNNINSDINLCLIDHKLPIKNGLEVTREVKKMNVDNYVMITSGIKDFDIAVAYLNAGADKFLKKSDLDYREQLIETLRTGFREATQRIKDAKEKQIFYELRKKKNREILELIEKVNNEKSDTVSNLQS